MPNKKAYWYMYQMNKLVEKHKWVWIFHQSAFLKGTHFEKKGIFDTIKLWPEMSRKKKKISEHLIHLSHGSFQK